MLSICEEKALVFLPSREFEMLESNLLLTTVIFLQSLYNENSHNLFKKAQFHWHKAKDLSNRA